MNRFMNLDDYEGTFNFSAEDVDTFDTLYNEALRLRSERADLDFLESLIDSDFE